MQLLDVHNNTLLYKPVIFKTPKNSNNVSFNQNKKKTRARCGAILFHSSQKL